MNKKPGRNRQASGATSLAWALLLSALSHALLVVLIAPATKLTPAATGMHFIFQASIGSSAEENSPKYLDHALQAPEKSTPQSSTLQTPSGRITAAFVIPDIYYEASELDTVPDAQQAIEPQYPSTALADQISGEVQLEMLIDEQGTIQSLRVLESSPPGIFDQATMDAFHDQRFVPGLKNGHPVKSRLKLMVHFIAP